MATDLPSNVSTIVAQRVSAIGVLLAVALLGASAARYPGGYDGNRVTVSALCAATTPNGVPNPARGLATSGLLLLCVSQSLLFQLIANEAGTRAQRKTIQVAGIGSMVYAALTSTSMHDLMVSIALAFHITAMLAVLYMLYRKRSFFLLRLGLFCLAVVLAGASIYYANVDPTRLGAAQKLSFGVCTSWLFAVQLASGTLGKGQDARGA